jgi:uncharacterized UPF0160 family protein
MKKVITHNGGFHADDVFGVATLQLHFGVENVEVIRTRDEAIIATGDVVLDVGGIYDPEGQRFDHHQNGAPVRDNGIPYAAFGLVWKHYGELVAGSMEAAEAIEKRLVMPIDANDNGVSLYEQKYSDVSPFTIQDMMGLMKPVWNGEEEMDERFKVACEFARGILVRAGTHAAAELAEAELSRKAYEEADDKRIIVSDVELSAYFFIEKPDVLFVVYPDENGNWAATAVRKESGSFATKVQFPETWRGFRDGELGEISGISDAVFCHKAGFLFVGKSKEGVLEATKKALASA